MPKRVIENLDGRNFVDIADSWSGGNPSASNPVHVGRSPLGPEIGSRAARFFINPIAGSLSIANNMLPRVGPVIDVLLSIAPPKDSNDADIQFPALADDLGDWRGDD
jgi:hypothetical protein